MTVKIVKIEAKTFISLKHCICLIIAFTNISKILNIEQVLSQFSH